MYPCQKENIIFRREEDDALLFNPETGQIKLLNYTSIAIWEICDGKHSLDDIIVILKKEFQDTDEEVDFRQDVEEFLNQADKLGFIVSLDKPRV